MILILAFSHTITYPPRLRLREGEIDARVRLPEFNGHLSHGARVRL